MVLDPSIVSPSLTGVFIGGGHNKHGRYRIEVHAAEAVSFVPPHCRPSFLAASPLQPTRVQHACFSVSTVGSSSIASRTCVCMDRQQKLYMLALVVLGAAAPGRGPVAGPTPGPRVVYGSDDRRDHYALNDDDAADVMAKARLRRHPPSPPSPPALASHPFVSATVTLVVAP